MNAIAKMFLSLAVIALAVITGAFLWRQFFNRPVVKTVVTWIERPVQLPGKVELKPVIVERPVPAAVGPLDSIISKASVDSLKAIARLGFARLHQQFTDTLSAEDSLGAFRALMLTEVAVELVPDGSLDRVIKKSMEFRDAVFRLAHVETTTTVYQLDFVEALLFFLAGVVVAFFAALAT